jgi:hypothetical protein
MPYRPIVIDTPGIGDPTFVFDLNFDSTFSAA